MYVCICKGITEKMLADQLSKKGSMNPKNEKEILKNLGIGDSCGLCVIDCLQKIQNNSTFIDSQTRHQDS